MAKQLPLKARLDLYNVMAQYARDGQSIIVLLKSKAERAKKTRIQNGSVFIAIESRLNDESIANSLKPFIPNDEYLFLRMAEVRSNLIGTLESLVYIAKSKNEMAAKFRSIMVKPILFLIMSMMATSVVVYGLVPQIVELVGEEHIDGWQDTLLLGVNPWLQNYLPIIVLSAIGLILFLLKTLSTLSSVLFRPVLDRFSILHSVYRDFVASVMLVSLGASLKGNESINNFFSSLSKTGTRYEKMFVAKILGRLQDGSYSIAEALDINFFDSEDMEQIFDYTSGGADILNALQDISNTALARAAARAEKRLSTATWIYMISYLLLLGVYMGAAISSVMVFFDAMSMDF